MKNVYIAATSAASALGRTLDQMWPALRAGKSAVAPVERFSTARLEFHHAACAPFLDPEPAAGRTREILRLALDALGPVPAETFVIWAGVKSAAEYIERRGAPDANDRFRLAGQYRRWAAERLGAGAGGMELNAACASSTAALALGAQMISTGERRAVLVCAADIVSRFTFMGFAALRALTPTACRPFDATRDGLGLGDGAAAVLLTDADTAREPGREPLARLTGWGIANDANHITGPARDGRGLIAAIGQALRIAGRQPDDIEAFCAHGTGTVYNDAMELTALETVFGQRRFPMFSIKGAIGHTLGAAGALETAVAVRAMAEGRVPPTAGLRQLEERARGRAAPEPQAFPGRNVLTANSGFGGVNAALILERTE